MAMPNFSDMIGTYEQRKVKHDTFERFEVDTALVTDRPTPYETAVAHKDFNGGKWIILGWSESIPEAEVTHDKWVKRLLDGIDELTDAFTGVRYRTRKRG